MSHNEIHMTVGELYRALDALVPRTLSSDWDNDGLACCPDPAAPVRGVLVALDPTEEAVALAAETGCNVLLTHHPLLFRGLKAVDGGDTASRKVIRLIESGVSAMAFHTRLDAADGGVNDVLAARLCLQDVTSFGVGENPAGKPLGRIGVLPSALSLSDFAVTVKAALSFPAVQGGRYTEHLTPAVPTVAYAGCGRAVHRVAVLGGAGADEVAAAIAAGADTYLTGELGYHALCDAPYGTVNLVSAGHYFTEFPVCARLADMVATLCPGTPVHILGGTSECHI